MRNRRLGKRDLMHLIDDIWREKRKSSNKEPMDVFVDKYFRERCALFFVIINVMISTKLAR